MQFSKNLFADLAGVSSQRGPQDTTAPGKIIREGRDPELVRARWEGDGRCECTAKKLLPCGSPGLPCHKVRGLPYETLLAFCQDFWSLSMTEQWTLVRLAHGDALKDNGREEKNVATRMPWYIGATRICFANFCHLLHKGRDTIRVWLNTSVEVGMALAPTQGRPLDSSPQSEICDYFWMELYNSAAEPMPLSSVKKSSSSPEVQKIKWVSKVDDIDDEDIFYDAKEDLEDIPGI